MIYIISHTVHVLWFDHIFTQGYPRYCLHLSFEKITPNQSQYSFFNMLAILHSIWYIIHCCVIVVVIVFLLGRMNVGVVMPSEWLHGCKLFIGFFLKLTGTCNRTCNRTKKQLTCLLCVLYLKGKKDHQHATSSISISPVETLHLHHL